MAERFPDRYLVNSLPINSGRRTEAGPRALPEKDNAYPPRFLQKDKGQPVDQAREEVAGRSVQATEANDHIGNQDNNKGNKAPEAASWE
jgi:hypothetical protein